MRLLVPRKLNVEAMDAPVPTSNSNELRDDDDISLTSTAASEPQDEYEVDTIYAEERRYGIKKYLVKWKGYSDLRCTWEPASSFNGGEPLKNWRKQERAIKQGTEKPFDIEAWAATLEASEDARDDRKRRRREKRIRLGLPPSKRDQELDASETQDRLDEQEQLDQQLLGADMEISSSSDDDAPILQAKPRNNTALPPPSQPNMPHKTSHPLKERDPAPRKTSSPTIQRVERPRIAAPEPVAMTMSDDRTKRRSLPNILHRAKEQRKSSADENNKTWKLLSTTYKFDKATRADHEPIQDQLELQKPGEWTPFQMSSYLRGKRSNENDSLFVEQDDDDDDMNIDSPSTPLINTSTHNSPVLTNTTLERQLPLSTSPVKIAHDTTFQFSSTPPTGPRARNSSPKKVYRVKSRELGKKSDLLCSLVYGPDQVEVGEISLCNLSDSARRTIFATKKGSKDIYLSFDELCSLDHYSAITKEVKAPYNIKILLLI